MTEKIQFIPSRLKNAAVGGHVAGASDIIDDVMGKTQDTINHEVDSAIDDIQGGSSKSIAQLDNQLNGNGGIDDRLGTVEQLAEISIGGGDAQIATGSDFTNPDSTKRAKVPTVGAVLDGLNDGVYDVSKRNPTGGPNSDGKFTLAYILANADTLIPTSWRHGGMTISFVDSSDNKYVQFRLMSDEWSATESNWQGIDDEPTAGSDNLVKSGGIKSYVDASDVEKQSTQLTVGSGEQRSIAIQLNDKIYKGQKFSFKVSAGTTGATEYNFYVTYEGQSSHTNLGRQTTFDEPIEMNATNNIVSVDIYLTAPTQSSGKITLTIYHDIIENIGDLYLRDEALNTELSNRINGLQNFASSSKNVTSGQQVSIPKVFLTAHRGRQISFILNAPSNIATTFSFYVFYEGQTSHTSIGNFSANVENTITLANDIYAVDGYLTAATTGAGTLTLDVKSETITSIDSLEQEVDGLQNFVSSSKAVVSGQQVSIPKVFITAHKGRSISFVLDAPDDIATNYAFYVFYVGQDEHTNVGSFVANVEHTITLLNDIYAVNAYLTTATTGSGTLTLKVKSEVITAIDALSEAISDVDMDGIEKVNTIKRYLPFTICMKQNPYYQASERLYKFACNLLFFTDSHTDETFFNSVDLKNVQYVVDFANEFKNNIKDAQETFTDTPVFDAVINAGDVISSGYKVTSEHDEALAVPFFDVTKNLNIPFIFAPGNHDTLIRDTAWASMYGDWAEQKFGLVRQTKQNTHKSTWSYYDIESKKIRVIAVDVTNIDLSVLGQDGYPLYNGGNTWYIAQEQMNWLINTALNFDDKTDSDWGVVCVMHQSKRIGWNDDWYGGSTISPTMPSAIEKFFNVCKAFNSQGTYSSSYEDTTDSFYDLDIDADFSRYATTKKWNQYAYTQNLGATASFRYDYFIKKDVGLTFRMDDPSGNLTQFHIYVWYDGATSYAHIGVYQPGQEYTIQLSENICSVMVYANTSDVTGNVSATFKILQNKPHIVCWLNGHEHMDGVRTIDGINIIWTICGAAWTAYSDQRVLRSVGTPTQNAFDCISIDIINRKIRMIRFGAGVNCFGVGGDRFLPEGLSY